MKKPLTIAIDYDGTYTADPEMWDRFIQDAQERGHRVLCVTSRYGDSTDPELIYGVVTVFTKMQAKRWFCNAGGVKVDIWIDDEPACIENGR